MNLCCKFYCWDWTDHKQLNIICKLLKYKMENQEKKYESLDMWVFINHGK